VKILLDHCVPKPFRQEFPAHDVKTAAQMGWEDIRNGELLAAVAKSFDVFVTVDKNMKREQSLATLPISVIILDAVKNTPDVLRSFAPFVELALKTIGIGQMIEIDARGQITIVAPGRVRVREELK
jgi:predicted nuclease of predicted toxin-antitoxin system